MSVIARRNLMSGKKLPYDRVVTAINSLNAQKGRWGYVKTGIIVGTDTVWECRYAIRNATLLVGASNCGNSGFRFVFGKGAQSWNDWYIGLGDVNYRTGIDIDNYVHTFVIDGENQAASIDDRYFNIPYTHSAIPIYDLTLFGRYNNVTGAQADTLLNNGEIYYSKIWKSGKLVQSLIPVVKDGLGYLYDEVTSAMFGNARAGGAGFEPECIVDDAVVAGGVQA